jgi:undecaprenyl-diphosphatase
VFVGLALAAAIVWRRPELLARVIAADVIADLLAYALRQAIARPRPPVVYPRPKPLVGVPHSDSFPSGHAATSFACAATLALVFPRAAVPLFVLAAAIAWSRVYVGVHYPLDVLGGAFLGLLVAAAVAVIARRPLPSGAARALRSRAGGPRRSRRAPRRG